MIYCPVWQIKEINWQTCVVFFWIFMMVTISKLYQLEDLWASRKSEKCFVAIETSVPKYSDHGRRTINSVGRRLGAGR
jgi:hypothetical protein